MARSKASQMSLFRLSSARGTNNPNTAVGPALQQLHVLSSLHVKHLGPVIARRGSIAVRIADLSKVSRGVGQGA